MTSSKSEWQAPFLRWPAWMCPTCQKSTLRPIKDSLKKMETGGSERAHDHDGWEPDWIQRRFAVLFKCTGEECGEIVTCSGDADLSEEPSYGPCGFEGTNFVDRFTPKYFHPPLHFFKTPPECPEKVTQHIDRAFAAAWSDPASTVNAMRTALEAILSDRGIPRYTSNKKKKRVPLSLQGRIEKYAAKDQDAAEYIEGLKWLGNLGSHDSGQNLTMPDLLEGFSVLEHAIEHIYVGRAKAIKKLAKRMVRRKGMPRRRSRPASIFA